MVRSGVISLFLLFTYQCLLGQGNRYMIFFSDKANSEYSIDSPNDFLSQKAIDRRKKNDIAIDASDLPVNNHYVQEVASLGISTYFKTKWMNGVLVEMTPDLVPIVESLAFVNKVVLVAEGNQLLDEELIRNTPQPPIVSSPVNEELSLIQNEMVGIPFMHEQNFKGEGIIIGLFDAGFPNLSRIDAFNHLFEHNQLLMTKDFTANQVHVETLHEHGLQVLSVLAADRIDFKGTAPNADYLLFITEDTRLGTETPVEEYNWLFAAETADSAGVDVISSSLGYTTFDAPFDDYTYADMNGENAVISRAAALAFDKGILVITSAGNSGSSSWRYISAPADQPKVISVGAVDVNLNRASFSSFGPNSNDQFKPDVMALGSSTAIIDMNGSVVVVNGTSLAAPIVSGLGIGLLQAMPSSTHLEIANAIRASGDNALNINNSYGYGIPNFQRALAILNQPEPVVEDNVLVYPNPVTNNTVFIKFDDVNYGLKNIVHLISISGSQLIKMEVTPNEINSQIELNMAQYPSGLYLLQLVNSNGKFTRKLIKY